MITEGQWKRWKDNSTTDDRLNTYVLSDIRQMLGEIERLREGLRQLLDDKHVSYAVRAIRGRKALSETAALSHPKGTET